MAQEGKTPRAEQSSGNQQQVERSSQGQSGRSMQSFGGSFDPFFFSPGEFFANPFGMMRRMHDEMDRMFAESLGSGGSQIGGRSASGAASWVPALEVSQRGDNMVVCAELPGLRPEDVHLEVTEDALVLSGERQRNQESNEGGIHRTERRYGQFYRAVPLPEGANAEQARAQFRDGVLEVTIPVQQPQSRRRQIPIQGGSSGQQISQSAGQTSASGQGSGGSAQTAGAANQSSATNR